MLFWVNVFSQDSALDTVLDFPKAIEIKAIYIYLSFFEKNIYFSFFFFIQKKKKKEWFTYFSHLGTAHLHW